MPPTFLRCPRRRPGLASIILNCTMCPSQKPGNPVTPMREIASNPVDSLQPPSFWDSLALPAPRTARGSGGLVLPKKKKKCHFTTLLRLLHPTHDHPPHSSEVPTP